MTKTLQAGLLLAGMMFFSTTTQAFVGEQQWGKWYGNISVMEFALNTNNKAGEALTLRCSDSQLAVTYEDTKGHYRANSESLNDVQLLIGKKA